MSDVIWNVATGNAFVPERVRRALAALRSTQAASWLAQASGEQARTLCALASGSEWATELLVKHADWLELLDEEKLSGARRLQGLQREVDAWLGPLLADGRFPETLSRLRQFKQREMIRIAARDLARLARTLEIVLEISNVADVCLGTVLRVCWRQLAARFGAPFEQDAGGQWRETRFGVLGMGKLGGQELNYSSDVDVLFVYSDEGSVFKEPPRKGKMAKPVFTNHQFFTRLAEAFVAEVSRFTEDGALFRVDVRLRPEGDAGPLVRSLSSYETYYAQWGQTWERMMLSKARGVAGDMSLAGEFLEMVQTFRYPRSVSERVLDEISAIKERIETEMVKRGEMERNVKLGRGGIREIEFVVQALQLLHAGRNPFLQGAQTLPVLDKLAQYGLLKGADAQALGRAYLFLRDVEHRLQMELNRQVHALPASPAAHVRMARLMGFERVESFEQARLEHTAHVHAVYERLLKPSGPEAATELPDGFGDHESRWRELLAARSFRDPGHAFQLLREFALGPGYGHVSPRTTELAMQLIPRLLSFCPARPTSQTGPKAFSAPRFGPDRPGVQVRMPPGHSPARTVLSDPDRVVARFDTFVTAYGARATLYEMWSSNPSLFELMVLLFDRSEFLAEVAIRTPDLVDQLVLSGHLRKRKSSAAILEELRHGARDKDQRHWIRRYHQSELMRIGLRDILGLADYEQNFEELSALADACLQYALEVAMRKNKLKSPPFAVMGWGKLGGCELNYGSDLDITLVAPNRPRRFSDLQKMATEIMDLLSSPTEFGVAFVIDTRLRPDGEKGLLVNTVGAYEDYYRKRAQLWEIQSLTRARFIAGDAKVGERFQALAAVLTNFSRPSTIVAFRPDWIREIARMRDRIEKERTPRGQDALAIKTGVGGLIDAEFIAQAFCLEHGWQEANTLAALRRAQKEGALQSTDAGKLIENYRKLRRVEAILRRWSYAGETVLPDDPAPLYRVAVRCGFATADEFMRAVGEWRKTIREVYRIIFK